VALSGGIDSSVTTALSVKALGPERVLALLMPERHSSDDTLDLSSIVADHFGVEKTTIFHVIIYINGGINSII